MKLIQFALLLSHIGRILATDSGEVSWHRTRDANLWKTYHPKAPSINFASDSEEPTNIYKKIQETFSNILQPQNQIVESTFGVDVVLMDLKQHEFVKVMEVVKGFNPGAQSPVPKQVGLITGKSDYGPIEPKASGASPGGAVPEEEAPPAAAAALSGGAASGVSQPVTAAEEARPPAEQAAKEAARETPRAEKEKEEAAEEAAPLPPSDREQGTAAPLSPPGAAAAPAPLPPAAVAPAGEKRVREGAAAPPAPAPQPLINLSPAATGRLHRSFEPIRSMDDIIRK